MPTALCEQHIHLIAQLLDGKYACSYCGQQFTEYHELHLTVGVGVRPTPVFVKE
jgi:hypothetical protein